jgi:hypothetical protein
MQLQSPQESTVRSAMRFMLLALVYIPLREGLDEVAWQIGARKQLNATIARLFARVVQSRIRVERQQVALTLVLVGSTADTEAARLQPEAEILEATNVTALPRRGRSWRRVQKLSQAPSSSSA